MNRIRIPTRLVLPVWLTLASGVLAAEETPSFALTSPIVFTQLPADAAVTQGAPRGGGMLRADYGDGCRIVRLDPDRTLTVLTEGFAGACEPDVSFDGERMLFAGKQAADELWNVWEIALDGSGLRQITRAAGNCRRPAYQSTLYTIVSTEPQLQVMFQSDLAGQLNELGSGLATSVYSCGMDGSGVRRLTMNLSDDVDPYLMSDGLVLCSSWQRRDAARGFQGRISLFALNPDGADYALYSENGEARIRHMACDTATEVVFVEADRVGWDGAGRLAAVSRRRPFHSYRAITATGEGLYHSPAPLGDGAILVSRRPDDGSGTHRILRLDPSSGKAAPVHDDPAYHDFHARVVAARARPDGRSSVVAEKYLTGKLYCLNAALTAPGARRYLEPGTVRAVRVIEGVPLTGTDALLPASEHGGLAGPGSSVHGLAAAVPRRLLGVAPVEEDGSFQLEIPPDTPIMLQTLDQDGMALFSCGWIWAKHREWRGCIGCHEDPERVPENRFVHAVRKPAVLLTPKVEQRRSVTFERDVMPTVAAKCASCHDGAQHELDLTAASSGAFNRAYRSLLEAEGDSGGGTVPKGRYVHPGRARTSPLVWRLFGRNTARPWDEEQGEPVPASRHPSQGAETLTDRERSIFVEWIDLGAAWNDGNEGNEGTDGNGGA